MSDLEEVVAACLVEYARSQGNGVLSGTFYVFGKDARDAFNLPYVESLFSEALNILEDVGVLNKYQQPKLPTYYRLEVTKFEYAFKNYALDERNYTLSRNFDQRRFKFLEAFADLGPDFLAEALESYEVEFQALAESQPNHLADEAVVTVQSSSWTGLPNNFELASEQQSELVRKLDEAEAGLADVAMSQEDRAQARALIIAARTLAEAPSPPYTQIWDLIGRANEISGIASLLVSIISLFVSAMH
jgi:hypothetical protein